MGASLYFFVAGSISVLTSLGSVFLALVTEDEKLFRRSSIQAVLSVLLVGAATASGGHSDNWEVHPVGEFEHECLEVAE